MRNAFLLLAVCFPFGAVPRANSQTSGPTLKKVAEVDLPGPPGKRFDYLTIDTDDHYLLAAHLAAGQTYVIDLRQMKVVKKLHTEKKPDGSAYAAPFHKLYVSDERGDAEAIVDVKKDEIIKTLHFDRDRDAAV
jgi:DNA-binding beta-propeller fold protein YncE